MRQMLIRPFSVRSHLDPGVVVDVKEGMTDLSHVRAIRRATRWTSTTACVLIVQPNSESASLETDHV